MTIRFLHRWQGLPLPQIAESLLISRCFMVKPHLNQQIDLLGPMNIPMFDGKIILTSHRKYPDPQRFSLFSDQTHPRAATNRHRRRFFTSVARECYASAPVLLQAPARPLPRSGCTTCPSSQARREKRAGEVPVKIGIGNPEAFLYPIPIIYIYI